MKERLTIGLIKHPSPIGGPGTFQAYFEKITRKRGHRVVYPEDKAQPDIVLVLPGTKKLKLLWNYKRKGAKIVHRLGGINWRHRIEECSLRIKVAAALRNQLVRLVRNHFADHIIYQSHFVREWWVELEGETFPNSVIHNGTDCSLFTPQTQVDQKNPVSLVVVEGSITGDRVTLAILRSLSERLMQKGQLNAIHVFGNMAYGKELLESVPRVSLHGTSPRTEIAKAYHSGSIFLSMDINAACPNAVIEAMASGLPIVGFDTGALGELVSPDAGALVPYGGNPWKGDIPDCESLATAILDVLKRREIMADAARQKAKALFNIEDVVDRYLDVMKGLVS